MFRLCQLDNFVNSLPKAKLYQFEHTVNALFLPVLKINLVPQANLCNLSSPYQKTKDKKTNALYNTMFVVTS